MKALNDWQRRRAVLSHDVLKNGIAPSLAKLCRVVAGEVDAPGFLQGFAQSGIRSIEFACNELDWLLGAAEELLSPRQLFRSPPLDHFPAATMQWLPDALHKRWVARVELDDRKCDGRVRIDEAKRAVENWREAIARRQPNELKSSSMHLRDRVAALTDFTSSLNDLPPYRI